MFKQYIKILACLSWLISSISAANEFILSEPFDNLSKWTVSAQNGVVSIEPQSELKLLDSSSTVDSIRRTDITIPDTFSLQITSKIDQFTALNFDSLGVRIRNGAYRLEFRFRNNGLYVLMHEDDGVTRLRKVADVDNDYHQYKVDVAIDQAELFQDGISIKTFTLPTDTSNSIVYLFIRGNAEPPAQSHIDELSISQIMDDTPTSVTDVGGGDPMYSKQFFSVFDKLPLSTPKYLNGQFGYELQHTEEPTQWTAANLDPARVWRTTLSHNNENDDKDWQIRVGKAGQIYSFTTAAGELIPPQEHAGAEWIDEVFQVVTVNTKTNNRDAVAYPSRSFVHQAGTYWSKKYRGEEVLLDEEHLNHSWYSPMLAQFHDQSDQSYSSLTWGQYSHVPSVYKSGQLIYTKTKDLGDGVIEFTQIVSNRGEDTINWLNVPWGGVRASSLPNQMMSNPDGSVSLHNRYFGQRKVPAQTTDMGIVDHIDTGGWFAWTNGTDDTSNALAVVFGRDQNFTDGSDYHYKRSHFKWGEVKDKTRDYNVGVNIVPVNIAPGESFYYRYYMLVGTLKDVQVKANELIATVHYGKLDISEEEASKLGYVNQTVSENDLSQDVLTPTERAIQTPDISFYTDPINKSVPLFLMRNTQSGAQFISDNPYENTLMTDYDSPYVAHLDEHWNDLSNWVVKSSGGVIAVSDESGLHLSDSSKTVNAIINNKVNIPDIYRVKFTANITKFGQVNSDALLIRLNNAKVKFDIKFRNNKLFIVNESGNSLTEVASNIPEDQWQSYEWLLSYNGLKKAYYAELSINGIPAVNPETGSGIIKVRLPNDATSDKAVIIVRGDETGTQSYLKNLAIEDQFYTQLQNRQQLRPYDGSTDYIGFLGFAMPENHEAELIRYTNLSTAATDASYYPNPNAKTLQVLEDYGTCLDFDEDSLCDVIDSDDDNDGVPDEEDIHLSIVQGNIIFEGQDSEVTDRVTSDGLPLSILIDDKREILLSESSNNGEYVSEMIQFLNELKSQGLIDNKERNQLSKILKKRYKGRAD